MTPDPHRDQPVLAGGHKLAGAAGAVILVHGRGASAEDILNLGQEFDHPELAYLAPQAAGGTWYPYSFLSPIQDNEPVDGTGQVQFSQTDLVEESAPTVRRRFRVG